ncbi:MAG TPA: WecB/TagA/CpsF family glycosyltransferase [Rhodopila sp.]|nr:WecB/TagA/CpsF family glycosyltransferase [Rhodopila sp.]
MCDPAAFPVRWFLGVPFTPMALPDAASRIADREPDAPFCYVTTPNAQHVVHVDGGNTLFTDAHDGAWLVLNDSKILSLLAKRLFGAAMPLAAGSDLTQYLFRHHIRPQDPITVIGGSDEVERRLRADFGIRSLARYDPPMGFYRDPAEIERCVDFIVAHPARYVFLAVGAPQSETVALRVLARGGATGVGLCVGSSLHFVTGVTRRAPALFRRLHLEALYRLMQNPRRHAKRVFVESVPVLWIGLRTRWTPAARRSHVRAGR